jgi:hypothetical protein
VYLAIRDMVCTEVTFACFEVYVPLMSSTAEVMLAYTVLKFW